MKSSVHCLNHYRATSLVKQCTSATNFWPNGSGIGTCLVGLDPFAVEVVEPLELHDQDGGQAPDLKLESRLLQLQW